MTSLDVETRDGLHRVSLDKPRLTIGRLPGNDIVLPFAQISRHHAEVRQRGNDWWIIDLSSTNGLRIGSKVVREYLLHDGDAVMLAPHIVLHFIDARVVAGVVEGSTVPLQVVAPPSPAAPAHLSRGEPPGPVASPGSAAPSAEHLAAAAGISLPRRRPGMTAPPSTVALPPSSASMPAPFVAPSLAPDTSPDDWLNDVGGSAKIPVVSSSQAVVAPPLIPAPPPTGAPSAAPLPGRDATPVELPLSSPYGLLRQQGTAPASVVKRPLLYTCPICGERTAPDSPYCWSCHSTIAQACPACHLYLLPIQARCPRCQTPNPKTVRK